MWKMMNKLFSIHSELLGVPYRIFYSLWFPVFSFYFNLLPGDVGSSGCRRWWRLHFFWFWIFPLHIAWIFFTRWIQYSIFNPLHLRRWFESIPASFQHEISENFSTKKIYYFPPFPLTFTALSIHFHCILHSDIHIVTHNHPFTLSPASPTILNHFPNTLTL